jgi:hypothetical protein
MLRIFAITLVALSFFAEVLPLRAFGEGSNCAVLFTEGEPLTNPLPQDGIFARVVSRKYANEILAGSSALALASERKEVFVAAYEDIADVVDA